MAQVVDAAHAAAAEHNAILALWIRAAVGERNVTVQDEVVPCGRTLKGHQLRPQPIDLVAFRKETMPAKVDAVAVVDDST